jgi:hypothetical protein
VKLIVGGEYQGKLDYALERFGLAPGDVWFCEYAGTRIVTDKPVIYKIERWVFNAMRAGLDPEAEFAPLRDGFRGKIIICTDISCGVVPADPALRAWRETVGRVCARIARDSDEVVRMFCGISTTLSPIAAPPTRRTGRGREASVTRDADGGVLYLETEK